MIYLKKLEEDGTVSKDTPTLELQSFYDEMLKDTLQRFNNFRSPDNQITELYNQYNQKIPLTFRARSTLQLFFKTS